jgi:hypothetical protein
MRLRNRLEQSWPGFLAAPVSEALSQQVQLEISFREIDQCQIHLLASICKVRGE